MNKIENKLGQMIPILEQAMSQIDEAERNARDAALWRNLHITLSADSRRVRVEIDFGKPTNEPPIVVIDEDLLGGGPISHCVHPHGIELAIVRSKPRDTTRREGDELRS